MKKFHHNYLGRSNEAEKKERKVKKHHSEEACKCFAPFVKLHWHDCPLVNKPCPIHGNHFNRIEKEENNEPVQNVTVSFYPSLKTERLFQPVKSLLAHCNPETKINFQYYSQRNFAGKENTRDRFIQTNSEDFKRTLSNVFVEKTKSFITNKTNKMKKLKQCFYSPCNSIARRSLSQNSVREKTNEIPFEEGQHRNVLFNRTFEEPLDDITCDSSFEWFSPRKLDFENLVKLSDERRDSDFITFTKGSKNNGISHKIFEIKHKKGLNDISAVKFPKQSTQFVYSTYNIDRSIEDPQQSKNKKIFEKKITPVETKGKREKKKDEISTTSSKSQSSSSGSVYFTPFLLMPTANDSLANSNLVDRGTSAMIEPLQVKDSVPEKRSTISKETQTTFQEGEETESLEKEKPQLRSVSLQTEPLTEEKDSQIAKEIFLRDYEPSMETLKDKLKDYDAVTMKDDVSDEIIWKKKCSEIAKEKINSSNYSGTSEVQANNNHSHGEVFAAKHCGGILRDQESQTEPRIPQEAFGKTLESEADNARMMYLTHCSKSTQTSFSEGIDFQSSDVVTNNNSFDQQEGEPSSNKMAKIWQEKSCSDTELYERKKCKCAKANSMAPLPEVYVCKCSNLKEITSIKESAEQKSPNVRFLEDNPQTFESNNLPDAHETVSKTQKAVERLSKAEQTSLKDEFAPQAFSDLSELKKIIQKYFENTNPKEDNQSEIDKKRMINVKTDRGTMTDSTVIENKPEQSPRKINNAGTQTTVHILINEEVNKNQNPRETKVKFRQSVLLNDERESKTFFVCAVCGREIRKFCINVSTNTDTHDVCPKIKEKTTVIDTTYSKIIEVKTCKKAKNPYSPAETISCSKPIAKLTTSLETERSVKTLKSMENTTRDINLQKSCIPILITEPGSGYIRRDRNLPEPECQDVKPLLTNSPQIRPKCQTSKTPAAQQLYKHCICNEIAGTSTSATSRVTTMSTMPNSSQVQKPRVQPKNDIYPSLPIVEHPGVQNSQWRKEERSPHSNPKPRRKNTDGFFYPVSVKPVWPIEVRRACEPDNSACSAPNQKRSHEKELEPKDVPAGKKIKAFNEEFKNECFLFGKPTFSDLLKERDSESIWVPSSSVPQVSSQNDSLNQYKTTKSEDFMRISQQRKAFAQVKKYESDTSRELFTVESCHLKPVSFKYDQQPFNNLFECSICKSLTFVKTNKKNTSYFWPRNMLSYHRRITPENSTEKVVQETTPDNLSQYDEKFLRENVDFSDMLSLQFEETPENNIPEEEEEVNNEFEELYPESNLQRSKSKSQSQTADISDFTIMDRTSQHELSSSSESLNTFRFDKDSKKYKFKKLSK